MRATGKGREIKLKPVDEDRVMDHPARAGLEALMDQKLFHQRIKSERASAYWFAAALWGVTGLVMGALLGVWLSVMVQTGTTPLIRDNIISGAAMDEARDSVNSRPPVLTDPAQQPAEEQQP